MQPKRLVHEEEENEEIVIHSKKEMALTEGSNKHSYNVIKFLELPYENINKYIIIPHSWIRIFLQSEGTVIVAYPTEDEERTYKRVILNENFKKEWKRYTAVVKYGARSFEEARSWISEATLGNFNMYHQYHSIETEMDHNGNSSSSAVGDNYDDDDCIIVIKEEPIDIYDNFDDVVIQINEVDKDDGIVSISDDEQIKFNVSFSGAQNLIASLNDDLEDDVTSPIIINDEEINQNDYSVDANNFAPRINTDGTDTSIAHTDGSDTNDSVVSINNDTNKHAPTSLNNGTNDFVNPAHNNDAIEIILPERSNSANNSVAPINNTDIDDRAAVNNCVDDCVPLIYINESVDYIALERNNNTNNSDPFRHNANNCTDSQTAPNRVALSNDNGVVDLMPPINNNEANGYISPTKDGSGNNNNTTISNEENFDKNVSPQNMPNPVTTTSTTNKIIETERPCSVNILDRSKSSATRQVTCATMFCDCSTTLNKPRMTVMPLINAQNGLAASNSIVECIQKQQLTNNDKKIDSKRLRNHLTKINWNSKEKQTNPILQDDSYEQLSFKKNWTSNANNAFQQANPQESSSTNMPLNTSENLNLVQKHKSSVSINYWTQDHYGPLFVSPSAYVTSFQNNTTSGNETLRRALTEPSHHNYNKESVIHENSSCAESVKSNKAHYTVNQINHTDQTAYSRNVTATVSTQYLTEYPTYTNSNSGQQTTFSNKKFTLAKAKFSLASVQQSKLSHPEYNNLPVTLHESHSSIESVRAEIDYRINQKNRIDEKIYTSNVKNATLTKYSTHKNINYDQQTCGTINTITTLEPPKTNPLYQKKTQRNSPTQSQQNSSNYTLSVQPPQIIISKSTNQVPTPQNIAKNQSSLMQKTPHFFPPDFQRRMPHNPQETQIPVKKPMESNSVYFQSDFPHNIMGQPVLQNPGHRNANMQISQFIRPLNSNSLAHNTPTIFPNLPQAPHTQGMPTAISTRANNMYQGPRFERCVNTEAAGVQNITHHAVPFSDNSSIDRSHVVQDTKGLFLRKPTNTASHNQKTSVQSTLMNLPLGEQQHPPANQLNQYSGRFSEQHSVPINKNNQTHTSRLAAVNMPLINPPLYQQNLQYSQNIESLASSHSIQREQYHCPNKYLEENQHAPRQQSSSNILQYEQYNCTELYGCGTNHTKNIPNSKQKYKSLMNQAEASKIKEPISPSDSSDEGKLIIIEPSNNPEDCVPEGSKNIYYEKSDQFSSISLDFAVEETSKKEATVEKTNNAKNKVQRIALKKDKNYLPNNCTQYSRVQDRRTSLKKIKTHLKKMKSMSSKTYIWKKLKKRINAYIDRKSNECSSEVNLFQKNTKEKTKVQNSCLDDDKSSGDDSKNDSYEPPPKRKYCKKWRRQVLPPEYDPNDTKWTLKYREASPELTELIYKSNIFVSSIALATCKRIAKDYKTLARLLLTEVFKQAALEVCSLSGVRARVYNGPESKVKAGLHPLAVDTIMMYVETYGHSEGWGLFDSESVKTSLRNKLDLYRRHKEASTSQLS